MVALPAKRLSFFVLAQAVTGTFSAVDVPKRFIAHGVSMPVISIGTGGTEKSNASVIVANWMSLGGRGVDTAQIYGDQAIVAKAIADAGVSREEVFITSKIGGCFNARTNIENDLKLLNTSYIDLLLIHFPTPPWSTCVEAWATLEELHAKGVLKAIGVSNFKKEQLEKLVRVAKVLPALNQIEHNVLHHDDSTVDFALEHKIAIEAYSPLGRGGASGDIPGNKAIQAIAAAHNVSTYQVALRWIYQHGHLITFQSTSRAHQEADADIFNFDLTQHDMSVLDNLQTGGTALLV